MAIRFWLSVFLVLVVTCGASVRASPVCANSGNEKLVRITVGLDLDRVRGLFATEQHSVSVYFDRYELFLWQRGIILIFDEQRKLIRIDLYGIEAGQ